MLASYFQKDHVEAGCDEAGRGCLAGPVFAAAVIFPRDFQNEDLNDSKALTAEKRYILRELIEREAIAYAVGQVSVEEIDEINILNASFLAMHRALDILAIQAEYLLIDGNRFNAYKSVPHQCIVQGDGKYLSIAAASILAKTYRDDHMVRLAEEFPQYGWKDNKGYATEKHRKSLLAHGSCKHHRKAFIRKVFEVELL